MHADVSFRIALGFILGSLFAIRLFYQLQSGRDRSVKEFEGPVNVAVRAIGGLLGMSLLIAYLVNPSWMKWSSMHLPSPVRWVGAPLGILGLALLLWVHRSLGENFRATLHLRQQHTLTTSGPYQWIRHPMYTAFFVIILSFYLLSANWAIGLIFAGGLTGVIINRIAKEERLMHARFGSEYEAWANRTGRFLPRLH